MLTPRRLNRIRQVIRARQPGLAVVLEDIHDPHNAAAVMRTCDAFGIQDVHVIYEREEYRNLKRIGRNSSSSANKWLSIHVHRSAKVCLSKLKYAGFTVIAAALSDDASSIFKERFAEKKIALIFGNEHRGLSEEALAGSDRIVAIPMSGMVQSLNLSVTAALFIYEVTRRRQGKRHFLPLSERRRLEREYHRRA